MAANGISTLATKAERQIAKLELAQTKRQLVGTAGYRELRYYDANLLPARYQENDTVITPHPDGLQAGRPWKTTPNILAGLWRSTYTGYYDNDPTWFDAHTPIESIAVDNFNLYDGDVFSSQWLGYFQAPHTATYTFYRSSDDASGMWLGANAITGYTNSNQFEGTIALTEGELVPIRLQYGNSGSAKSLNFSWSDDFGPAYSIVPNSITIDEGGTLGLQTVTYTITTTNVADGTRLYWTNSGTTNAADIGGSNSGYVDISGGSASLSLTATSDATTETSETIIIKLRTVSVSGTIVATADTVTVGDTSQTPTPTPTYVLATAGAVTSVNEGTALTFNVTTTNIADGTTVGWLIDGYPGSGYPITAGRFSPGTSGTVTINNNTGTFTVTVSADSFTATTYQEYNIAIFGLTTLSNTLVITVNDTSQSLTPVTQDLILFFDSERPDCYPGTGTNIYNIDDLHTQTPSKLFVDNTYSNGVLRILNTDTPNPNNRISGIQCQTVTGFKTISLWYKQKTSSAGYYSYILDARDGMPGGWVYDTPGSDWFGSDWGAGTMFIDGGASQSPTYTQQLNVWRNVTFVTNGTAFTDNIALFSRNNHIEGLDVEFGAVMIYSRTITEAENKQNYDQFKTRYLLSTYELVDPTGQTITITKKYPFKITVRSTSYQVTPFVNAQISIDDTLVVDTAGRGHTVLALTSTGTVIEQTRFDTWNGTLGLDPMNVALLGYPTGTVIAICTYDATSLNSAVRSTLNTYYGGTLTDTWGSVIPRYSHIFIGQKV